MIKQRKCLQKIWFQQSYHNNLCKMKLNYQHIVNLLFPLVDRHFNFLLINFSTHSIIA